MTIDVKKIKKLKEETGAGVLEVKKMLEECDGDIDKAKEGLMKRASEKASKKADRDAGDGLVYSYIHNGGKVGSMVLVACETDFVAKTDDFKKLCNEVAMQVCTEDFNDVKELLESDYIRDPSKTILDLVNEATAKLGEKIEIKDFYKLSV
ncbi:MAG: translation elongation factor Ts [Patescibacteria group bacterium]|nr:translation elongation factor Ts [Patescibacteria group bacterium]